MTSTLRNRADETANAASAALQTPPAPRPPILPLDVIDEATQRLWASSLFVVLQAYKLFHVGEAALGTYLPWTNAAAIEGAPGSRGLLVIYSLLDIACLLAIQRLRIPRLDWPMRTALALCGLMLLLNWILMGNWRVATALQSIVPTSLSSLFDTRLAINEVTVRLRSLVQPSQHIVGRQTIHILPFATASLNPAKTAFCLTANSTAAVVALPLIFNNTRHPHSVRYSIIDFKTGHRTQYTLSERDLASSSVKSAHGDNEEEDELEEDWAEWTGRGKIKRRLEKSQKLYNLQIRQPGLVVLEGALNKDKSSISIGRSLAIPVTQCPSTSFTSRLPPRLSSDPAHLPPRSHRCIGATGKIELAVEGVAPLSLQYTRSKTDEKPEQLSLTGLGGGHAHSTRPSALPVHDESGQAVVAKGEYGWAAPERIVIPLEIPLTSSGQHDYRIDLVRDSLGHSYHPSSLEAASRTFVAHEPAKARVLGCSSQEPLGLAQNKTMRVSVALTGGSEQEWNARIRFTPDVNALPGRKGWERDEVVRQGRAGLTIAEPGTYELTRAWSEYCEGDILLPSSCTVVWLPLPTLETDFSTIKDECAGEIGVRAGLELTGTAPFVVHYAVKPQHGREERHSLTVSGTRGELSVQPERSGRFSLEILDIDDANYRRIPVAGKKTVTADVRPLASASFVKSEQELYSCQGDMVQAQVALVGEAPFDVGYEVVSGSSRKRYAFKASASPHTLSIALPNNVEQAGSAFDISLLHVEDGRHCKRTLKNKSMHVEVHRTPPSVRFSGDKATRSATIKESERAHLPLRLTGHGPWHVKYRLTSPDGKSRTVDNRFADANAVLAVSDAGTYELLELRDAHCPGTIDTKANNFSVVVQPRPSLDLQLVKYDAGKKELDGTTVRPAICAGVMDSFDLQLKGTPPLKISYEHSYGSHKSIEEVLAVTANANIVLSTSNAGTHRYRILGVSDAIYGHPNAAESKSQLTIKQEVHPRPAAWFDASSLKAPFCVRDALKGTRSRPTPELHLTGTAPFEIYLEVREPSRSEPMSFHISDITSNTWSLKLDYAFTLSGLHDISVRSIADANGCERNYDARDAPRTLMDVAEIATIAAVSPQNDYCVGQSLDFTLQGTQPWTVTYQWTTQQSGKRAAKVDERTVTTRDEMFSRLARAPGVFRVLSVAHEADQCRSEVEDIVKTVHPLPTARVGKGVNTVFNIHEGEQAEIVFHFEGTPPFSFTYERSAPEDRARKPQVIEKHTINNIEEHSYSVYTNVEGTWSVTFVQDRYCAFPPVTIEPQKRITNGP